MSERKQVERLDTISTSKSCPRVLAYSLNMCQTFKSVSITFDKYTHTNTHTWCRRKIVSRQFLNKILSCGETRLSKYALVAFGKFLIAQTSLYFTCPNKPQRYGKGDTFNGLFVGSGHKLEHLTIRSIANGFLCRM